MLRLMHQCRFGLAVALCLAATWAAAGPITAGGVLAGHRGELVSPTVVDAALVDFEAADLTISFDPTVLTFQLLSPGPAIDPSSLVSSVTDVGPHQRQITLSFATGGPGPFSGIDVEVLIAAFQVLGSAPIGTTVVSFLTTDPTLYDLALDAVITVLPTHDVPEGGTAALVGLGLAALIGGRWRLLGRDARCTVRRIAAHPATG